MDRRRAAGALLALAACIACSTAAPTASNQTALELLEGSSEGCYYNFQHYGEGDRIMTNEPCLNCTCHNRMLMCYLKVCPFTKPIGQDCTIEKRADQCCPIVTCPDVPVDLLTSTSTSSPAEYGATGLGKVDKYGCSINGKYFPEGSKVPPTPNKPCEHCYCIRNMTTCVMQECTLHVDGCTPIYHKDVCCPVRYSCDHLEDEMLLLDDMTTTVRPTPGFLLTTTTVPSVTQISQNCVHDDQIFADGALIKTEVACEHCYCMKGDIVCVVQECGTPMENEGKNCTSLPPRQGQCCPDTYICEGDELLSEPITGMTFEELTTLSPPRRIEGSGYRNEPDEPYTEIPSFEGSGEEHATTLDSSDMFTPQNQTPQIIDEIFAATEESFKPSFTTVEPDTEQNTVPGTSDSQLAEKTTHALETTSTAQPTVIESIKETDTIETKTTISDYHHPSEAVTIISKDDEFIMTTESVAHFTKDDSNKITEKLETETQATESFNTIDEVTTQKTYSQPSELDITKSDEISQQELTTPEVPKDYSVDDVTNKYILIHDKEETESLMTTTPSGVETSETTSINPVENEIDENGLPPGRIPGEGDCLLNGITYKNNTNVPNINNCHSSCKCMSSIVKCDPIICSPPPEHMDNMNDCQPIYDTPDACCPTYVCHSRETIPPESHSQMSGTESPKQPPKTECHGEQCQPSEINPILPELCNSDNCEPKSENQEKECKNGACEPTDTSIITSPPPLKHNEACIGEDCVPSAESCTDGKCQQSATSETICDKENGCQPSEACEGNNCVIGSEITTTTEERPICKDSDECKISDTSKCDGSKCDTSNQNVPISNDNVAPLECTEENCRRKEQSQENKTPLDCSGSNCITPVVNDELSSITTESTVKHQINKETTTEAVSDGKLPDYTETPSDETKKVTHFEITTEHQDTFSERSTDKPELLPTEQISETVTEKGELSTGGPESLTTKTEETITELYSKPEPGDYQTTIPETYKTTPKEQVTESIENITKETLTESPFTTQYEEHPTELPKKDVSGIPTQSFTTSTETLDIEPQEHEKNKYDVSSTSNIEEFTQSLEIFTEPTNILTTSKLLEIDVNTQEYTKKQEIFTESPKDFTSHTEETLQQVTIMEEPSKIVTQGTLVTESQPDVLTQETSATLLPAMSTDKHIDFIDNDATSTEVNSEAINIVDQFTTEQSVQVQQSSEPYETKLDEAVTDKIYNEIEKEHISTENSIMFTEVPVETTTHEIYKMEEKPEVPQTTDMETLLENIDTDRKTTISSFTDQENLSQPTETYITDTDKQHTYTISDESQEHVTTISPIINATHDYVTDENLVTQALEIPVSQKGESNLFESTITESSSPTMPQEFDMQKITTHKPEISITNTYETTYEDTDAHAVSSVTVPETLGEHAELSTTAPKEILREDTTHKEHSNIEPLENGITTNIIPLDELEITSQPIPSPGLDTTVSSILSEKDEEVTTKYKEPEVGSDIEVESTVTPEKVYTTKSDESTSLSLETEKKTSETSTSSREQGEGITTESLIIPYEDKSEIPDYMQTNGETLQPSISESTLAPMTSFTEGHADSDKTIQVSTDESETKDKPLLTTPETSQQFTEKQDITVTYDHVTEGSANDIKTSDSGEDTHEPNIVIHATEKTIQPHDMETKLTTKLHIDHEMSTVPTHVIKEEGGQTELPMSLVTEPSDLIHSDDTRDFIPDKTTQVPQANIDKEETKTPDYGIKPEIPYSEAPHLPEKETTSVTTSHTYSGKEESQTESSFSSLPPDYTMTKITDYYDKEQTPSITEKVYLDISTEVPEKLAPTSEYQEATIFTQNPIKTDSELYSSDILDATTSVAPTIVSSEKTHASEQEISTKHAEISSSITTVAYDNEPDTKPEDIPVKEYILEATTGQPQINLDISTPDSKTSETLGEEHGDTQQDNEIIVQHTISDDLPTTKSPETIDQTQDKPTDEHKPSEQEEQSLTPEQHATTEGMIYTEQSMSSDNGIQSSIDQDQDKSTDTFQTSDENSVTTSVYQEMSTIKEESPAGEPISHLSTTSTLTTDSSANLPVEENNIGTLSPGFEITQSEEHTTEKQQITESTEMTKTHEMEQSDITQEISSNAPGNENATLVSISDELDRVTLVPQTTEDNLLLHTETVSTYQDQHISVVTESIIKHTTEDQVDTFRPETTLDVSEKFHTELPITSITEKDERIEETTAHVELIKIPVDTIPVEIATEYTEPSILKETNMSETTETEAPVPLITDSEISMPITEPSVQKETDNIVATVTEVSEPEETETSLPETTKATVAKETVASLPEGTTEFVAKITEVSVDKVTEATLSQTTESSVIESSSAKIPEMTETYEPAVTEVFMPEVTKTSVSDAPESSGTGGTEASVVEVTEVILPDVTGPSAPNVNETSVPDVTESTISIGDTSVPKETESETINREPERTTYKPIDEKSEMPAEPLSTLEPLYSSSETTPYLVELQEHTTKVDEDMTSVTLTEDSKTKLPENYQTERGDQPLDNLPDKFTQEYSHDEHTTKETFTKKDEQSTTLPPDQDNEYLGKFPDKTEDVTTDVSISSESPLATISDAQISQHTTSEEQIVTITPTVSVTLMDHEKLTTTVFDTETTTGKKDLQLDTGKTPESAIIHEATSPEDALIPTVTKATTIKIPEETSTHLPIVEDKFTKPEDKPSESYSPTTAPEYTKPGVNEIQPTEEVPQPDFPPSGYGQEPDYVEEDQAFGPGTCRYGGKVYVSAQQIPRDDPCDFCFCFRSDIICLQQSCPPPIHGCHEEPIQGFCCPRYECPVSMATTLNVTTTTTTTTTTLPPHFLPHAYKGAAQRRGCQIKGHSYKVGEVVRASSGPCLHCTCGGDGQMKCDPKACTPEPMLRQMIAAAVSAKRRR